MQKECIEEDVLLVDKPKGISSFDVIRYLRRELGIKKIGHAGTLDPLATGLMVIGIGSGTKKLSNYIKLPKTYVATVVLGERSATGDAEGEIVEEKDVKDLPEKSILDEIDSFVGEIALKVPAFSAIKQGGEALYKKARRGETVDVPRKKMSVFSSKLISIEQKKNRIYLDVEWDVSSGTYIRSLAEELGRRIGYPARIEDLRRTKIDNFRVEDAKKIKKFSNN